MLCEQLNLQGSENLEGFSCGALTEERTSLFVHRSMGTGLHGLHGLGYESNPSYNPSRSRSPATSREPSCRPEPTSQPPGSFKPLDGLSNLESVSMVPGLAEHRPV